MDFNRCERCGSFFAGVNKICNNCMQKENLDMYKLKNYFETTLEENSDFEISKNLDNISYATGITSKNLTRQLQNDIIFKDLKTKF